MFDKDGDRTVDASELKSTLRALGYTITDDEIKKMMEEVDEDNSGKIEFPEFCQLISSRYTLYTYRQACRQTHTHTYTCVRLCLCLYFSLRSHLRVSNGF